MLKVVVFLRRKQGMTREAFIEHYETRHVPLVRVLLPTIGKYVRNYLSDTSLSAARQEVGTVGAPTPYFDVITELWFDDQQAYDQFVAALSDEATSHGLREDEERFLDRSIVQTFSVAEYGG